MSEERKMTAVEWLIEQIYRNPIAIYRDQRFNQAKRMEKEQIEQAYDDGKSDGHSLGLFYDEPEMAGHKFDNSEQYYNQTYKNK
jgi:hypothetical protein